MNPREIHIQENPTNTYEPREIHIQGSCSHNWRTIGPLIKLAYNRSPHHNWLTIGPLTKLAYNRPPHHNWRTIGPLIITGVQYIPSSSGHEYRHIYTTYGLAWQYEFFRPTPPPPPEDSLHSPNNNKQVGKMFNSLVTRIQLFNVRIRLNNVI